MNDERTAFLDQHREVIAQLCATEHHPELKEKIIQAHRDEKWCDHEIVWALGACQEEDVMIEMICLHMGWDEDRMVAALRRAGWSEAQVMRALIRIDTLIN